MNESESVAIEAPVASTSRRRFVQSSSGLAAVGLAATPALWTGRSHAQSDEFRVGWIRPTTGRLASSFAPLYAGGLIALEELNAAGGIMGKKIVLVEEDDEASPAKEPAVIRKLKSAGIDVVVGPTGSPQVLASLSATTPSKMIQCGIANGTELTEAAKYPYHFLCGFNTDQEGELAATYMREQLKIGKIGILHENTQFGETAAAATRRRLKQLTGADALAVQSYAMTATDLSAQMSNLQKAGCEGIVIWMASNVHIAMAFNLMARMNWLPPVIGHVNLFNDALFDLVPFEAMKSVYGMYYRSYTYTDREPVSPRNAAMSKKLAALPAAKGIEAFIAGCPHYDFLYLLKAVIEQEKSFDVEAIRRALNNLRGYKALVGDLSFSETSHAGLSTAGLTLAAVASGKDPRSQGVNAATRLRAPGA